MASLHSILKTFALSVFLLFAATVMAYGEAPSLRTLVDQGDLPPVEERMPTEPLVVDVHESIGEYGGTWRLAGISNADVLSGVQRLVQEMFFHTDQHLDRSLNILVDYEFTVSEEETVFRGYLRKGMKWSDGVEFTADDVVFAYYDILTYSPNPDATVLPPAWLTVRDQPAEVVKLDDHTFEVRLPGAAPLFLDDLQRTGPGGAHLLVNNPKHYLTRFHPAYEREDGVSIEDQWAAFQALNDREGFAPWRDVDIGRPVLFPWMVEAFEPGRRHVLVRNPYYWKVDAEGNQLPYIDRIEHEIVGDSETITLKAISGELDMQFRHLNFSDFPLYMEERDRGDYQVYMWQDASGASPGIYFNQTNTHPVQGELLRNRDFRIALSIAVDRDDINETLWNGMAVPRQATLHSASPFLEPGVAEFAAEYDPERAHRMLDDLGFQRDGSGRRLGPDGRPITLTVDVPVDFGVNFVQTMELVAGYWGTIGVTLIINTSDRDTLFARTRAGTDQELVVWLKDRMLMPLSDMKLVPTRELVFFASQNGLWYVTGGSRGTPPEGPVAELLELWDEIQGTIDETQRYEMLRELTTRATEQVWTIGTVGLVPTPVVVRNNFHNVPVDEVPQDPTLNTPKPTHPEQYFMTGSAD